MKSFLQKRKYLIELDGLYYRFSDGEVTQLEDYQTEEADFWFISDLPESISRLMSLDTIPKYADILAGKKLQESGELVESPQVIRHWHKKRGKNRTDFFFTALPSRIYQQYVDYIERSNNSVMLFSIYSLLLRIIQKTSSKKPVALIFRHSRFADILIASSKQVYSANQFTAFDQSQEYLNSLWEMIERDIERVEKENRITVDKTLLVNWFDAVDQPAWKDDPARKFYSIETTEAQFEGQKQSCSFLKALDFLTIGSSISDTREKIFYLSGITAPYANYALLFFALFFFAGSFWYSYKTGDVQKEIVSTQATLDNVVQVALEEEIFYLDKISFLEKLDYCRQIPSFKQVVNDISTSLSKDMVVEQLRIENQPEKMSAELLGSVDADFKKSYRGYQLLISNLQKNNYTITDSSFNTQIRNAEFILKFEKARAKNL